MASILRRHSDPQRSDLRRFDQHLLSQRLWSRRNCRDPRAAGGRPVWGTM